MIAYNYIDQRITDLLAELEASSETWVETFTTPAMTPSETAAFPLRTKPAGG